MRRLFFAAFLAATMMLALATAAVAGPVPPCC